MSGALYLGGVMTVNQSCLFSNSVQVAIIIIFSSFDVASINS